MMMIDKEQIKLVEILGANVIATTTDLEGRITYASEAFCKISGYKEEELINQKHSLFRHPDTPNSTYRDLWRTIQKGEVWEKEMINLKKNGGYYWVLATMKPNYDENHNVTGYISIRQDITDKKDKEHKIQEMIVSVVSDKEEFIKIKGDFEDFLEELPVLLTKDYKLDKNLNNLIKKLYKFEKIFLKKESIYLSKAIHLAIKELEVFIKKENIDIFLISKLLQSNLKIALKNDLKIILDIFGDNFLDPNPCVNIDIKTIEDAKDQTVTLIKKCTSKNKELVFKLLNTISKMVDEPFIDILNMYSGMIETVAINLEKRVNPLVIKGDKELFISQTHKPFIDSLVHIFINSIEHGIEEPFTRETLKKSKKGTIVCEYEKIDNEIVIKVSDDGEGIDTKKTLKSAIEKEIISEEKALEVSEDIILNSIFLKLHEHNKKGLGALIDEVDKLDGTIEIKSELKKGTTFIFNIPYKKDKIAIFNEESIILDCIIESASAFLKDNMNIEIQEVVDLKDYEVGKYVSTIAFNGSINIFCTITIGEEVMESIYKNFIFEPLDDKEAKDLMNSLPSEIVNTVAGLAISKFPSKYDDLVMSEPIFFDNSIMGNLKSENESISKNIKTKKGDFICNIIKLKD